MQENENEVYWGIDVSKDWLDIAINGKVHRVKQTLSAIDSFINTHGVNKEQTLAVLESTGGYEKRVSDRLSQAGIQVHIAHPNKVKAFAEAKGRLAKTDSIDAKLLASYGQFMDKEQIRPPLTPEQDRLQSLSARLAQLKKMHHQEACRIGQARHKEVKKSHQSLLKMLAKQIEQLKQELEQHINEDETMKADYKLLQSMKGVGPILAMALLVDIPELGKISKKEIAALVGVAPITKQSGQKSGYAKTQYGRGTVRKILYMGALSAIKYNPLLKAFYERLTAKGKLKKVAIVAVMRKMLVILNAMMQSKTCFNA